MKTDFGELLRPARKEKLHEGIVAQVKNLIHSEKLGVGDKLPSERDLAKLFKVSRVVVRESLRSLEQSGLIEVRPGPTGGAYVAYNLHKPLFDAAHDLLKQGKLNLQYFFEARLAVECFTVRLAAQKTTPPDVAMLKELNQRLLDEIDDRTRLRENNAAFHVAIADISGNPLLKLMIQSLLELLNVTIPRSSQTAGYIRNTYKRHQAIIEAIERKDLGRCERLMATDVENTAKLVI